MALTLITILFLHYYHVFALPSPNPQEMTTDYWLTQGQKTLKENLKRSLPQKHAKNVILFLGDGMGPTVVTAARIYRAQTEKLYSDQTPLVWETFPYTGLSKTYSVTRHTTDSAAAANAFLTGVKSHPITIGVGAEVKTGDCEASLRHKRESIAAWAIREGKKAGLVTNTAVTHATPANVYAHCPNRFWENDAEMENVTNGENCKDIARQLIEDFPGNNLSVILGGGRGNFIPNSTKDYEYGLSGQRFDGRNLIEEWINKGERRKYVTNKVQLEKVDPATTDKVLVAKRKPKKTPAVEDSFSFLCLFDYDDMDFEPFMKQSNNPSLAQMTTKAIEILSSDSGGYFLLVEGGRIDSALHKNKAKLAFEEVKSFHQAIEAAMKIVDIKETLIVVTADHSHTLSIAMSPLREKSILGTFWSSLRNDNLPWSILTFANGPSAIHHHPNGTMRRNLTGIDTVISESLDFEQPAFIPARDESHGGEDVGVYGIGPFSHLLTGVMEQNYIAHAMAYAMCVGISKDTCKNNKSMASFAEQFDNGFLVIMVIVLSLSCILLITIIIAIVLKRLTWRI